MLISTDVSGWIRVLGDIDVIETDDCDIFWNAIPISLSVLDDTECHHVIADDDSRRWLFILQ